MNASLIARILGLLFIVTAVAGVIPWIAAPAPFDAQVVTLDTEYRLIFGIFPVNIVSDIAHLLLGIWGVVAGLRFGSALFYCRCVVWFALVLVILGAIPITNVAFGVAPLYGWDIAFNLFAAVIAALGGYGRGSIRPEAQAPSA